MKVERPEDFVFMTYHMIDWDQVKESPSNQACVQCGSQMGKVEVAVGEGSNGYEGHVCHGCKRVLWVRRA